VWTTVRRTRQRMATAIILILAIFLVGVLAGIIKL